MLAWEHEAEWILMMTQLFWQSNINTQITSQKTECGPCLYKKIILWKQSLSSNIIFHCKNSERRLLHNDLQIPAIWFTCQRVNKGSTSTTRSPKLLQFILNGTWISVPNVKTEHPIDGKRNFDYMSETSACSWSKRKSQRISKPTKGPSSGDHERSYKT